VPGNFEPVQHAAEIGVERRVYDGEVTVGALFQDVPLLAEPSWAKSAGLIAGTSLLGWF
jgi:hypothetical protein